jgi:predicted aminopeptidase
MSSVGAVIRPGSRGTKKWVATYGDNLVCIRYRYDEKRGKRYTTAEIIVDEAIWVSPKTKPQKRVNIRIEWKEKELRTTVGAAGGRWDRENKVWNLPYQEAVQLGLKGRIV